MLFSSIGTTQMVTVITTLTIALLIGIVLVLRGKKFDTRMLAFAAITLALSFALSFVKFWHMPYGGSTTLASFVPLIIFSYIYGGRSGLFVGIIYGILQFFAGPYFLTPIQFLLDYILGFSSIALAGVVSLVVKNHRKGLIISVPVVCALRLFFHVLAGFIFYSSIDMMAPELPIFGSTADMSGFVYSFIYNASYVLPDMIIAFIVIILLTSNKSFLRLIEVTSFINKDAQLIKLAKSEQPQE